MAVSSNVFFEYGRRILSPYLQKQGYSWLPLHMDESVPEAGVWVFVYAKVNENLDRKYFVKIYGYGVQGDKPHEDGLVVDMRVWLTRASLGGKATLFSDVPLASYHQERLKEIRQCWSAGNIATLQISFQDISNRLQRYGIPLMEDEQITWNDWFDD